MIKTCWICKAPADSAEHIFKKGDLVSIYGRGPYKNGNELVRVKEGEQVNIQGPNSYILKYENNLCKSCNTTLTQPFDIAYEKFVSWVLQNSATIIRQRFINFENIYGDNFEIIQRNLFKYFVKSVGCRIDAANHKVPDDLVNLLHRERFVTALKITFAVNEDMLLLPESGQIGVGIGPLEGINDSMGQTHFQWRESIRWLSIFYWYACWPNGDLGSTWIANSQHIYLGSYAPLSPKLRSELIEQVKNNSQ